MPQIQSLLPLLLIVVFFWFVVLRPARARQAAQKATINALTPGQRVLTTSGLYGTIVQVDGDDLLLEVADGVVVRFVKAAVAKVIVPPGDDVIDAQAPEGLPGDRPATGGTGETPRPSLFGDDTPTA